MTEKHWLFPVLLALALVPALPGTARAAPFEIADNDGFGQPMTALTVQLPEGWQATGRVTWNKPCSANDMFEVIFNATTADGQSGLRIMPGHKVMWTEVRVQGVDPYIAQMAVQQNEQTIANMRTEFKNSNCHIGRVADSRQILQALVLAKRPPGARIDRIDPNPAGLAQYRAGLGAAPMTGTKLAYDAVIAQISYTGATGPMTERVWLSWYQFSDDPAAQLPGMPGIGFQTTIIETLTFAYAPAARAADLDAAQGIIASTKTDPAWFAKVQAEQKKRQEEQRRIAAQRQAAIAAAGRAAQQAMTIGGEGLAFPPP